MNCHIVTGLVVLMACGLPLAAQCGTPGSNGQIPHVTLTTDLWDSSGVLGVSNALPGAHWVLGVDLLQGPTPTPVGPLCIGFSPAFFLLFDSLSGTAPPLSPIGSFAVPLSFPPVTSSLIGLPLYLQGVVFDPGATGGLAICNNVTLNLKAPKVVVASPTTASRSIDIVDSFELMNSPGTALIDTIGNQGLDDFAISHDGKYLYTRDLTFSTPNRVRVWDITTVPATHLGDVTVSNSGVGTSRRGIDLSSDGSMGFFCDAGGVHRFIAHPASPGFLSLIGFAPTTLPGVDSLLVSHDDQHVYAVAGSLPPGMPSILMVIDTLTMTEVQTVPLTDAGLFLGFAIRGPVAESPDGGFVATMSSGFYVAGAVQADQMISIIDTGGGPTQWTEVATVTLQRYGGDDLAFDPRVSFGSTLYTVGADSMGDVYLTTVDWTIPTVTETLLATGSTLSNFEGGVDTTPDGNFIYAATSVDDTLRVLDAGSQTVLNSLVLTSTGLPDRVRVERRR